MACVATEAGVVVLAAATGIAGLVLGFIAAGCLLARPARTARPAAPPSDFHGENL